MKRLIWLALGAIALAACAKILGIRDKEREPFEHRAHVLAGVACTTCHADMDRAGDEGALHFPTDETCTTAACHAKPHDTRSCLGCHGGPFTAPDAIQSKEHLRFSHAKHDEPLRGNCARCHVGVAEGNTRLRPPMAACLSCHQHRDQFTTRDCEACHVDLETEGSLPASHMVHGPGWDRSHGGAAASSGDVCATCHTEKQCASCHAAPSAAMIPADLRFDDPGVPSVHRGGFEARHGDVARVDPGTCSTCHTVERCVGCHANRGVAAMAVSGQVPSPHPPGWIGLDANEHGRAARRDPASCASCHGGAGEALCVSCHRVGGPGGTVHPPGWSSTRNAATELPCRMCHAP